jgi:hypothetical protein
MAQKGPRSPPMNISARTARLLMFCVLSLLVLGCMPPQELYIGNKVTTHKVDLGKAEPQAGLWETFDIKINYKFAVKDQIIEIAGQAELGDHYKMVYDRVSSLDIYLFFLDHESRVLLTEPINRVLRVSTERTLFFAHTFRIPEGTKALSFGYSGKVTEWEGRATFYELPLHK